jgi:hypothetical protein
MSKKFLRNLNLTSILLITNDPTITQETGLKSPKGRPPEPNCSNRMTACPNHEKANIAKAGGELNPGQHTALQPDFEIGCHKNPIGEDICNQEFRATEDMPLLVPRLSRS